MSQWKQELLEGAEEVFGRDRRREAEEQEALIAELYEQIGRLKMESVVEKKSCPVRLRSCADASNRSMRD